MLSVFEVTFIYKTRSFENVILHLQNICSCARFVAKVSLYLLHVTLNPFSYTSPQILPTPTSAI